MASLLHLRLYVNVTHRRLPAWLIYLAHVMVAAAGYMAIARLFG
jgi:hypothetical protein